MAFNWKKVMGIATEGGKDLKEVVTFSSLLKSYVGGRKSSAASITAYARGVQAISEAVAQVSFDVHSRKSNGHTSRDVEDRLNYLINVRPNDYQNGFEFWRTAIEITLYQGNCFIHINRDHDGGEPTSLDIVYTVTRPTPRIVKVDGQKRLFWQFTQQAEDSIPDRDLIHIKFTGSNEDLLGDVPTTQFERALRLTTNSEEYANNVYEKNGNISVVLTTEKALKPEQVKRLSDSWANRYDTNKGDATVVLEEGMNVSPIQIRPDQAKFLENRKFQIQEIARILGVPTPILMDYSDYNYNTAETADLDFYKRAVSPKVDFIEKELTRKLLTVRQNELGKEIKGDVRPLFRADMETRVKYLQDRFSMGSITPNQVRIAEGDEPMEGMPAMDKTYIMTNLAPSDKIESIYDKKENIQEEQPKEIEDQEKEDNDV